MTHDKPLRTFLDVFLSLRGIMLIGSIGAIMGSVLMFLQGTLYLYEAWHTLFTPGSIGGKQLTVPVLEAVDSFLFGIVLDIFAYGIAIGFVFNLPHNDDRRLPAWMKVAGVGQLKETLAEVVLVVLIVIFARTVVEAEGKFEYHMLVLPISILFIAAALRLIDFAGAKHGANEVVVEEETKKLLPSRRRKHGTKP
jgi:uncharacterized membrane protein YqhA